MVSIPSRVIFLLQCLLVVRLRSCSPLRILRDPLGRRSGSILGWRRLSPKLRIVWRSEHESKLLHRVLPLKHRLFSVADDLDYTTPRWLNPDFARLTGNKMIAKSCARTVSFADMEKVGKCSCSFLEGNSHSLWLLSALLSQLKQDGFTPSDPALLDKPISSLSSTLASQTSLAAGLSDFVVSKRRESYLARVTSAFCSLEA